MNGNDLKTEELTAAIREIQERVRARHPGGSVSPAGVAFPDLMGILHARDAAGAKVAAIGTVNPRRGGVVNAVIQRVKRLVSRALDWHVREQVEFNRAAVECVQAILETFEQNNRALSQVVGYAESETARARSELQAVRDGIEAEMAALRAPLLAEIAEMKDIRAHWQQWRQGFEEKRNQSEIYLLRTTSELNAAFQHRTTLIEESFRKSMLDHNAQFQSLLGRTAHDIQQRLWQDLKDVRAEFERLIFDELRVMRQRSAAQIPAASPVPGTPAEAPVELDWLKFADRFRGSEQRIRASQARYTARFAGATDVLDIGCGRGEFLEAARDAGIGARGVDLSEESVALCRAKGLQAEVADLFAYLAALPDRSLGGVYCSQVIEHLPPARLPDMIRLLGKKLRPGAVAAFETPNPACLAIFATHFYIDPTHTRPVPSPLLAFYLEECGFGQIEIEELSPAVDSLPELAELPAPVLRLLFNGLDYAVFAVRL